MSYIPQQPPVYNFGNECNQGYPHNIPCGNCNSSQGCGCGHGQQKQAIVKRQVVPMNIGTQGCAPKPFNLTLDFSKVPSLKDLRGYVYIDPCCPQEYKIEVQGEVAAFSGLATIKHTDTNSLDLTITETLLANGLKEFNVSGAVPLQVNGALVDAPPTPDGYNFTDAPVAEITSGHLPVYAYKGAGSTAGQIFFSVDSAGLADEVTRAYRTVNYDTAATSITTNSGDPFTIASSSNAITVVGSDASDSANIGLRLDTASYNDVSITANGLLGAYTPEYIDTAANNAITSLDANSAAISLPVGRLAIWDNDSLATPVIVRKIANTGPNQWETLSTGLVPNTPVTQQFIEGSTMTAGDASVSLASTPVPGTPVAVYYNGQRYLETNQYTVTGSTVNFVGFTVAPLSSVVVDYYV